MSTEPACPDVQDLERLLSGQLAFTDVEAIVRHVEQCGRCVETVESLEAEDPLAEALRDRAGVSGVAEEPEVKALIERLGGRRPSATLRGPETTPPSPGEPTPAGGEA